MRWNFEFLSSDLHAVVAPVAGVAVADAVGVVLYGSHPVSGVQGGRDSPGLGLESCRSPVCFGRDPVLGPAVKGTLGICPRSGCGLGHAECCGGSGQCGRCRICSGSGRTDLVPCSLD